LHVSPVMIGQATELGNRQSRMKPHGVMPGRLFAEVRTRRGEAPVHAGEFGLKKILMVTVRLSLISAIKETTTEVAVRGLGDRADARSKKRPA
jgi:hypothetical protein